MLNKFTVLLLVVYSVVVVSALTDHEQFEEFKRNFNKQYTPEEEQTRFQNFQNNLRLIEDNNAKYARGEISHTEGINQFADLSQNEWAQRNQGIRTP